MSVADAVAPIAPAAASSSNRVERLLEAPILPTLLRLAAPNVAVMVMQAGVATAETYFVGLLGTEPLAGVALVFPLVMLMQMMSNGAIGGGVSSAVARALGAGRRADAEALALHAALLALSIGLVFTGSALIGGPMLYRALGADGPVLEAALGYSNVIFVGAAASWLMNLLASVLRGTGNMLIPASVAVGGAAVVLPLSPSLIFGWGPLPPLGVTGAAAALVIYYLGGCAALLWYLRRTNAPVRLRFRGVPVRRRYFADILRVGAVSAINTVLSNLSVIAVTGFVGTLGTAALAGYGIGARLEYLQIPIVFGIGAALVAMVGANIGAGRIARAHRIAWTGAALAAAITGTIGGLAALFPSGWVGLFSDDPAVLAAGAAYFRVAGPAYGFFGLGMALYFASQGAGRMAWPLAAGFARLAIAVGGAWLAVAWGGGLTMLFAAPALALAAFGLTIAVAVSRGAWRRTQETRGSVSRSIEAQPPVDEPGQFVGGQGSETLCLRKAEYR